MSHPGNRLGDEEGGRGDRSKWNYLDVGCLAGEARGWGGGRRRRRRRRRGQGCGEEVARLWPSCCDMNTRFISRVGDWRSVSPVAIMLSPMPTSESGVTVPTVHA